MKRRSQHASTERAGIIAVTDACNRLNLIWRDLLQEDVGVDGTIEIVLDGFPTGKLVGGQVKSGASYIHSETLESFRFYPNADDLEYWRSLTLPLFLFVHDPRNGTTYWFDVQRNMENRPDDPLGSARFDIPKTNILDARFCDHLKAMFDLVTYDNAKYEAVMGEFCAIWYQGGFNGSVTVTALDLFILGLWGLCSKVQFHLSLLTDEIRNQLATRSEPSHIGYDLSRTTLFPFLTGYFKLLTRHHLAVLDMSDLNQTLYGKLEWPAFIAPLTLNGRRFVEFLRNRLGGERRVSDHQHLSFTLFPHVQIEVFESYTREPEPTFGRWTDVIIVSFNPYLDYYHLLHFERSTGDAESRLMANQNIFYYELLDYLGHFLGRVPKDNVVCRYKDMPISPLICWLEKQLDMTIAVPAENFRFKPPSQQAAFNEELMAILAPAGAMTVSEQQFPDLRFLELANGEWLFGEMSRESAASATAPIEESSGRSEMPRGAH